MKRTNLFRHAALALCTVAVSASIVSCKKKDDPPPAPNTVVNVVANNGYSTLAGLVTNNAAILNTLNGTGPFTVFAPSNAAFTGVTPPSNTTSLLQYHVIAGQGLSAAQVIALSNGNLIKVIMANGDSAFVKASSAGVFINGIQVTQADLRGDNGVVHGIGRVLLPAAGNIVQTAQAVTGGPTGLDSLVKAVLRASSGASGADDIATVLSTANALTVFAPTNQAFADLFANTSFTTPTGFRQINDIPAATLRVILRHHVVAARAFSNDLANGSLGMFNGSNATVAGVGTANITIDGSGTVFNEVPAGILLTNVMARNGVVHVISKVLVP
jgi:uncharacterized surface protein with fasciclin (FAS1) repeats